MGCGKSWDELKKLVEASEHPREYVVDAMFALQEQYGYLTDEAVEEVASLVGMSPLEVEELASFYDFIYRRPIGKFVIRICDGLVCSTEGGEELLAELENLLGIKLGETTRDGLFSLLPVCCIGFCDMAPAMVVNGEVYGRLTPEKIRGIIEKILLQGKPPKLLDW
jgi:NADH-quinone oxidoreductase subunit E